METNSSPDIIHQIQKYVISCNNIQLILAKKYIVDSREIGTIMFIGKIIFLGESVYF